MLSYLTRAICLTLLAAHALAEPQTPLGYVDSCKEEFTTFQHPIEKVAVIGAGPSGLQAAATLLRQGFQVRLFERSDAPGGNWYHSKRTPVREEYPNRPIEVAAYTPDPRSEAVEYYEQGDGGLTLDERLREHYRPSPVWDDLTSNSSPDFTSLPDVSYPRDIAWAIPARNIERVVKTYASLKGLNVNDLPINTTDPHIVSYSTRVELLEKAKEGWRLSLKRLVPLPQSNRLKAIWWQEHFDAVVVATGSYDSPYVPDTPGLIKWSKLQHDNGHHPVRHSQSYRNPDGLHGKTVLIVGASVSASEIARSLHPYVGTLYVSIRNSTRSGYMARRSLRRISEVAESIPEVIEYGDLDSESDIRGGKLQLANGTWLSGVDEIILATGYRRSSPFLRDFIQTNSTTDARQVPILVHGDQLHALSWTGHYIPDPTLAFANVRPWTLGRYQSLAIAKAWKGTARLPSACKSWKAYHNENYWQGDAKLVFGSLEEQSLERQYVTWLNQESLIHGGQLVDQWPLNLRERVAYYTDSAWEHGYTGWSNFTRHETTPKSDWPKYDRKTEASAVEAVSEW